MGSRTFLFLLYSIAVAFFFYRDRCTFEHQVHTPAKVKYCLMKPVQLSTHKSMRPYYKVGKLSEAELPEVPAYALFT